ncbi:MAG: hypothetical protein ACI9ON_003455 [Limisphaerales bacterium]
MKLRIRGNTVRLRLTRGEVEAIGRGELVEESTHFPDGSVLRYQMVPGGVQEASQSSNDEGHLIRIEVPSVVATNWAENEEQVCLTGDQPFVVGPLEILVEKDFDCVTPRAGEDIVDTYPNPNAA